MEKFNEDSRVKIPAIIHLTRLGYTFLPKSKMTKKDIHEETSIFINEFKKSVSKINNKQYSDSEIKSFLTEINDELENNDLGQAFYRSLTGDFDRCKLIDFENFDNNTFNVVTELTYKNDEDEFRPDITILINGMPLIFIEVKKPNNREGILAERKRINVRCANQKFKKFMNITQLLVFSNNNEYDEESISPLQGAFYATPDLESVKFNCFREENKEINKQLAPIDENIEKEILKDTNLVSIVGTSEYITNKGQNTPTNGILTSLLSKERLKTILKYGIAYVNTIDNKINKIEKHIMRYPQLFATLAIENKIKKGIKKGIIWHTQGSGKTALAFYSVYYLRDYYQKIDMIPKFYFITDRLDLATQAKNEFESRGLKVELISSKQDFIKNIKTAGATTSHLGKQTIAVVNIQKFSGESISKVSDYNLNVQRIYFLDEVHRSYNPKGSFLANLISSDRNAALIGLTGTPLVLGDYKSKEIFGDYIHKYYYNQSISDGYTLKLIREGIETNFQNELNKILDEIEIKKGSLTKREVYSNKKFVNPLTAYILNDFKKSRIMHNDDTIGGMIVCDTSEQAKMIYQEINKKNKSTQKKSSPKISSALILHDVDNKEMRKDKLAEFKQGKIDLLIVYNMLLTGFDAKRLKKLYLCRIVKEHNLLQTLTRVNRPYKNFRYGYLVDFADIRKEFDKTNKEYFNELQIELGDEVKEYSSLFKSAEEIDSEIKSIKENLFIYNFSNLEEFQKKISQITNKKEILELRKALEKLKDLYNIIRTLGHSDLYDKFPFDKLNMIYSEVSNRVDIINLKETMDDEIDKTSILNLALENIQFTFHKISEHELIIADQFRAELEKTRKELLSNFDKKDPLFITLSEELKRIFKKKNIEEITSEEMKEVVKNLHDIYSRTHALNMKDELLADKYEKDSKFAKIHKRIKENNIDELKSEIKLHEILLNIKHKTDISVLNNHDILNNPDYFSVETKRTIIETLEENGIKNIETARIINNSLVTEYMAEVEEYR
ncbi:MAG TPA: type I restriction endonuclease [archaeon]|nr:type I restriction endonuclease [archaeon]